MHIKTGTNKFNFYSIKDFISLASFKDETLEIIGPEESVTVVDNSVEGLYFGLSEFKKHESTLSNFNFDAYKEKNLKIWSRLFNKN